VRVCARACMYLHVNAEFLESMCVFVYS
jgi:hypothetical protein